MADEIFLTTLYELQRLFSINTRRGCHVRWMWREWRGSGFFQSPFASSDSK